MSVVSSKSLLIQIPYRIMLFVLFGLVTSAPFIIMNLDLLRDFNGAWGFTKNIVGLIFKGMFIGLSTVFEATKAFFGNNVGYGTLIFGALVLVFATFTIYQPVRLFMSGVSFGKNEVPSFIIALISLVIVWVILTPIAHAVMGGETITSGVNFEKKSGDVSANQNNVPINQSSNNNSTNQSNSVVNSLNMLTSG
jgi:hypothetical protein